MAPAILGLDVVRSLAAQSGLILLAHPAWSGAHLRSDHGLAPRVLLGDLFRLAGADVVNLPLSGGRFAVGRGEIPHRRIGKQIRFSRRGIMRWLRSWSSQDAEEGK